MPSRADARRASPKQEAKAACRILPLRRRKLRKRKGRTLGLLLISRRTGAPVDWPRRRSQTEPDFVVAAGAPVQLTAEPAQLPHEFTVSHTATMTSLKPRCSPASTVNHRRRYSGRQGVAPVAIGLDERCRNLCRLSNACADVSPHARQPGRSGISAKYLPYETVVER